MAKIRGFAVMLILFGLVGGIAPLCGYQNRLISSVSNDLNIYYIICLLAIISGIAILYFTRSSYSHVEQNNGRKGNLQVGGSTSIDKTTQTIYCPFCSYKLDRLVTYCPSCLNNISEDSRITFCFNFSEREEELRSILKRWISHPSFSVVDKLIINYKYDLSNSLIKMIDNYKPDGLPLVRENEKLNKLCREVSTNIINSSFFIGVEFAEKNKLSIPISNLKSIPREARELLVVAFQDINNLIETLMSETWPLLRSDFSHFEKMADNIHRHIYSLFIDIYNKGIEIYVLKINKLDFIANSVAQEVSISDAKNPINSLNNYILGEKSDKAHVSSSISTNKCPCCGNSIKKGDQYCRKCGTQLQKTTIAINNDKESKEEPIQSIFCPYCGKEIDRTAIYCPYCFRDIPHQRNEFDFDFQKREVELLAIVNKWQEQSNFKSLSKHLSGMVPPLMDALFKLVDEGHQQGKETIKRNFDLSEKGGQASAAAMLAGFCLGLEYGINKKQTIPITTSSIPPEVGEMLIVAYQAVYSFAVTLIIDISKVKKIDEKKVSKMIAEFRDTAMGVILNCYRLGVATISEENQTTN